MTADPYLNYPDETKTYHYINQHHYRGRTVHCDLRFQTDQDFLIGWTLLDGITDEIKEPVLTLKDAKELDTKDIFKIDWKTGKPKKREIKDGVIRAAAIRALEKKPEPLAWFEVEGVTPPGSVGATKEFPGVFHIIDRGIVEYGAQKPYFHEYFLSEGKMTGRIAFRMIGREMAQAAALVDHEVAAILRLQEPGDLVGKGLLPPGVPEEEPRVPYYWVAMLDIDPTPYVLSTGAVEKKWLPPKGISALPRAIRKNVPKRLQFWKFDKKQALEAREELAGMEELGIQMARHAHDKCMDCDAPPTLEVLWAEGMAHAWFCQKHFQDFAKKHIKECAAQGFDTDIISVKEILDGEASPHFQDNKNPNIWPTLLRDFRKELVLAAEPSQSKAEFILQHHWWRGPIVIRFGPSTEHWDLRILQDKKIWHLVLKNNPLDVKAAMGYEKPCTNLEAMEKGKKGTEELEPSTEWNPTKDTPAFIKALDFGDCVVLEDSDLFKKVDFKGKELKGPYAFTREDPDSDFWIMSASDLTKTELSSTIDKGGNTMVDEITVETEEQKAAQAEGQATPAGEQAAPPADQESSESPTEANKPSEKAIEALKESLDILKPFKDDFSARVKRAIDTIAGGAGYGYPPVYEYPKPGEYPKPYPYPEVEEFTTPPEAVEAIKKALEILQPFKDEYSARVKYSIDVLAGAAGYGYPKPYVASCQIDKITLLESDEPTHSLEVTIIKPGPSTALMDGKPVVYSEAVLKESIPLWDGAAAFCDHFNKSVRNIAGVVYSPWWEDSVKAKLRILDPNVYTFLCQLIADRDNNLPIPDIGISADLQVNVAASDDIIEVTDILRVNSADIVFSPAAGGSFDRVLNAAGISIPSSEQHEPAPGSSPKKTEGAESEEELVPVSRVRDLQSTADKLRVDLSEKESLNIKLQEQVENDVTKYRDVLVQANPLIPEELIQGASVEELDASIVKATQVVEKVKSSIDESTRIPAGSPVRSGPDLSEMSASEKIKHGLTQSSK